MIWAWAQSVTAPTYWVTHEEGVKLIYNTDIYDMEGEGGGGSGWKEKKKNVLVGYIYPICYLRSDVKTILPRYS